METFDEYIGRLCKHAQDLLNLNHWKVRIATDKDIHHGARTIFQNRYLEADIEFSKETRLIDYERERDGAELMLLVMHEFAHFYTSELLEVARDYMPRSSDEFLERIDEKNVESLARLFVRMVPTDVYEISGGGGCGGRDDRVEAAPRPPGER